MDRRGKLHMSQLGPKDMVVIFMVSLLAGICANLLWQKDIANNSLPFGPGTEPK